MNILSWIATNLLSSIIGAITKWFQHNKAEEHRTRAEVAEATLEAYRRKQAEEARILTAVNNKPDGTLTDKLGSL